MENNKTNFIKYFFKNESVSILFKILISICIIIATFVVICLYIVYVLLGGTVYLTKGKEKSKPFNLYRWIFKR